MIEYGRFSDAHGLLDLLARRKAELGLSNEASDIVCGFTPGYTDKLLGPSRLKSPSLANLDVLLTAYGLSGTLYVDADKVRRVGKLWTREGSRYAPSVRSANRISKALVARARPAVLSELGRRANEIRWQAVSPAERKRIGKWLTAQRKRRRQRPGT